jgi:site-specific DNA-methyltransferase (adenine-specific)
MRRMIDEGVRVHSVVTDPPYHLTSIVKRFGKPGSAPVKVDRGFMGKVWDGGDIAFQPDVWRLCFDLLPPGGHLLAFGGTRTYHRLAVAIEDAGFEIRDAIMWHYGSGFPKSHDVSKGIDRAAGAERKKVKVSVDAPAYQRSIGNTRPWMDDPDHERDGPIPATAAAAAWSGWGTALKPATEIIALARKPLAGTVAANVEAHGTGALNIDGCRIEGAAGISREGEPAALRRYSDRGSTNFAAYSGSRGGDAKGRRQRKNGQSARDVSLGGPSD